jgi:cell wall-associated NlpC family hydrolase
MNKYASIILVTCLVLLACQPSTRYRSTDGRNSSEKSLHGYVNEWLGTPYKYGGMSKQGTDCSGFTRQVMLQVYNKQIPRQSQDQYTNGKRIAKSRIEPGDLVFFNRIRSRGIDHVGIYLGDGKFAHASEKSGVTISSIYEDYYQTHYAGACRYGD